MRVISGEKRGTKLISDEGLNTRPTTDRVKECVFNILQFDIYGKIFLDLFAGSGQMGIEAVSRGAGMAVMTDSYPKAFDICSKNIKTVKYENKVKLYKLDAINFVKSTDIVFDVAYIDPPYGDGQLEEVLPLLTQKMSENSVIMCEHSVEQKVAESINDFKMQKQYKYGKIMLTVYRN